MWPDTFEERLVQWNQLRRCSLAHDPVQGLADINNWWWQAPQVNHHLHWLDRDKWPDPWQLLSQDRWCDLARALGIAYTIIMIDTKYASRISLVDTDLANLVLVDNAKYILNWCPGDIVNIASDKIEIKQRISGDWLAHQLG